MKKDSTETHLDAELQKMLSEIDFESFFEGKVEKKQANFWLEKPTQKDLLKLQRKTNYKFGRKVVEVITWMVKQGKSACPNWDEDKQSA